MVKGLSCSRAPRRLKLRGSAALDPLGEMAKRFCTKTARCFFMGNADAALERPTIRLRFEAGDEPAKTRPGTLRPLSRRLSTRPDASETPPPPAAVSRALTQRRTTTRQELYGLWECLTRRRRRRDGVPRARGAHAGPR